MRVYRPRPVPLPWHLTWRTNLFHLPLMTVTTALCALMALSVSLVEKSGRMQHRIARFWARLMIRFGATSLTIQGAENLHKFPVAVYAANHTSYMDTPVIFAALPFQFRILAMKALWGMAFIGWYLHRSGQLPVDTNNPRATLSSLAAAARSLRAGMPLFLFPEGARTSDGELKPFLSGAAYLAIRAQVPLVPIAIVGAYELLPIHTHHLFPSPVTLSVGEPIATQGMTLRQADELTAQLRAAIQSLIDAAQA